MGRERIIPLDSAEETIRLGLHIGQRLWPNAILALKGNLGAGKTTFVQGLSLGLKIDQPILSPTYVYFNSYEGTYPLFHFDLYRLKNESDFLALGFEEYFEKGGISAIEWPERISTLLPEPHISISFSQTEDKRRIAKIKIEEASPIATDLLNSLNLT